MKKEEAREVENKMEETFIGNKVTWKHEMKRDF
jgi:hypothetical protein